MKRFLQLLCALAFCLALTPSTALAADEPFSKLYVGKQLVMSDGQVTHWTTNPSTGELTYTNSVDDWNVEYDPITATLTLRNATIDGGDYNTTYHGAGIYALGLSEQPVSLTIELTGTNTITGIFGFFWMHNEETH